jgi:hypothetical protein
MSVVEGKTEVTEPAATSVFEPERTMTATASLWVTFFSGSHLN